MLMPGSEREGRDEEKGESQGKKGSSKVMIPH